MVMINVEYLPQIRNSIEKGEIEHVAKKASSHTSDSVVSGVATFNDSVSYKDLPINERYKVTVRKIVNDFGDDKSYWNYLECEVWGLKGKNKWVSLGSYTRNYSHFFNTFFPFVNMGQHYALYSYNYTATRVMKLPECVDIGGEEFTPNGFCPTGYYVPCPELDVDFKEVGLDGQHGFVSGCLWGDDFTDKVQYLDLSNVRAGEIKRDARFGYHELPRNVELHDAVNFDLYTVVQDPSWDPGSDWNDDMFDIATYKRYTLNVSEEDRETANKMWENSIEEYFDATDN